MINLPDLADFLTIDNTIADIASFPLEEIQKIIQASDLALHVPEEGKIVTSYKVLASTQKIWRKISLFVIFDALEDKIGNSNKKWKANFRVGIKLVRSAT